ncbi:hypothetical protein ACFE04_030357 [Oxalis oulophora]
MSSDNDDTGSYNYRMFNFFNRKFKITELEPPLDVREAFMNYTDQMYQNNHKHDRRKSCGSHSQRFMNVEQLRRFLVLHQDQVGCTISDAQNIIEQVLQRRHRLKKYTRHGLDLDDFFYFLCYDDLNGPIQNEVRHDMTAPLSHYFIYTGHNSYLTGNQLSSDCSEVPIIKALQRGVRVIELDLWPNSNKDAVHVLHGRTLTTPVPLGKCLKSIKEYAFVSSPYPVIITLEDHLTPHLQSKVAEMVTQTFGDLLYYPESDLLEEFPSPEELIHRIIISTKPPKEYLEVSMTSTSEAISVDLDDKESDCSDPDDDDSSDGYPRSGQIGAPEYKRLITIHAGKPRGNVKKALKAGASKVRRLSLSEQALSKAASSSGNDIVRFTQRNIIRVYPKGTRVNSSNYNAQIGWMHGAQMIAFNMQGYGKNLWLMHGMFKANGGCGYVKKPDFLIENGPDNEVFDPKKASIVTKTLKVKVYTGDGWRLDFSHTHFDTYSPPDFYTKVHIVGVPADCARKKTKIILDNWVPVWNQEFTFPLTTPELALLLIEVREYDMSEKDDFGGQTCLPVSELQPGIRSVALFDRKGEKLKSTRLLMRFQMV